MINWFEPFFKRTAVFGTVAHRFFSGLRNKTRGIKNPYYRKKGFYEWRQKLIYRLNRRRYLRNFVLPKSLDHTEAPIKRKGEGHVWEFKVDQLPISKKRLKLYTKLLTNLHLQDAIDWLCAMPTIRTNRILNSLSEAQQKIYQDYGGDPSRLYLDNIIINYTTPIKQIKFHALGNFGIMKTWRNVLVYRIREMPLEEFYQKIHILGHIPKCMGAEMRNAINQKLVSPQIITEWYPYLTAHSRFYYRKYLKWLNDNGKFDYYRHRRNWIQQYATNLQGFVPLLHAYNPRQRDAQRKIRGLDDNLTNENMLDPQL
ncbi:bifunctional Ribosomal protein L22-L17 superfamily/Ribosomal protein L22-L17 [Babesia duncani]|uniref:Bifunctional Ribosomal protein L22-L17 superfamily/Ribosomal protein L22-L17 n=1 Tax=Babesia duncani TaxID=323732 RepID=A0AAD9UPI0_9APIC|nr:bifunctional Ribosomal protein L22-L17 superfamily/Ribosomal protein L22-L17 [Babesia duncani]